MVELVDTQDLESCGETHAGSIPVTRTKTIENAPLFWTKNWYNKKGAFIYENYT